MTLRNTLNTLRHQLEGMMPEDPVTEIVITLVDASASEVRNRPLVVGKMTLAVSKPGEMVTEMFDEGDPRRVQFD